MRRFKRILCEAGLGETRERVLERAVGVAVSNQAELTVIDIVEPLPTGWLELESRFASSVEQARRQQLEHALVPYRKRMDINTLMVTGTPFLCLTREVLSGGHDLLIRESEDPDWLDRVLGSDDMQLLRACPCPVWLLDPKAPRTCRRILVAVDVDRQYPAHELETRHALNRLALELACSQAIAESAELHVVHAWRPPSTSNPGMAVLVADYIERTRADHALALADLLRETTKALGSESMQLIERKEYLVDGSARRVIPEMARRLAADLVVMGSVARSGIAGLFIGNTAEAILNQLGCSVLVVKPPGFATPVPAAA